MKKINSIINITKEVLEKYEKGLNILEIDEKTHEIIGKILKIKDDIKYILEIDLKDIDSITNKLEINDSEKQIFKDNIHTIKTLLKLNEENNDTYELSLKQIDLKNKYLDEVEKLLVKIKEDEENTLYSENKNQEKYNKYKKFYDKLTNIDNKTYIDELDIINDIFTELKTNEKDQRKILFEVMKYNNDVFKNNLLISKNNEYYYKKELSELKKESYEFFD